MKMQLKTFAGLVAICMPVSLFANTGIVKQTGSNQSGEAVFQNTTDNTVLIDQSGSEQNALVTIKNGGANEVNIDQTPLALHTANLLIRKGNSNLVNIYQGGLGNSAGDETSSRLRIVRGDNNTFTIEQSAISAFNDLDVDVINGDDNDVFISQQAVSLINNADVRIEDSSRNDVDVYQTLLTGENSADVDINNGGDNTVYIEQALSALSMATVDIVGSNADYTINQFGCFECNATAMQQ